jgi:hypothetical protein
MWLSPFWVDIPEKVDMVNAQFRPIKSLVHLRSYFGPLRSYICCSIVGAQKQYEL